MLISVQVAVEHGLYIAVKENK